MFRIWGLCELHEKLLISNFQAIQKRLCSSFVLPVFWGRVTEVEGPAWNTHRSPLSAHTSTSAHKVMHCPGRFATQWSQCSCFCGNEEWFMFHCLEMSRHLSKLCWANGRIFLEQCVCFSRVSPPVLCSYFHLHAQDMKWNKSLCKKWVKGSFVALGYVSVWWMDCPRITNTQELWLDIIFFSLLFSLGL